MAESSYSALEQWGKFEKYNLFFIFEKMDEKIFCILLSFFLENQVECYETKNGKDFDHEHEWIVIIRAQKS